MGPHKILNLLDKMDEAKSADRQEPDVDRS